jgi:hypothetical protein
MHGKPDIQHGIAIEIDVAGSGYEQAFGPAAVPRLAVVELPLVVPTTLMAPSFQNCCRQNRSGAEESSWSSPTPHWVVGARHILALV